MSLCVWCSNLMGLMKEHQRSVRSQYNTCGQVTCSLIWCTKWKRLFPLVLYETLAEKFSLFWSNKILGLFLNDRFNSGTARVNSIPLTSQFGPVLQTKTDPEGFIFILWWLICEARLWEVCPSTCERAGCALMDVKQLIHPQHASSLFGQSIKLASIL